MDKIRDITDDIVSPDMDDVIEEKLMKVGFTDRGVSLTSEPNQNIVKATDFNEPFTEDPVMRDLRKYLDAYNEKYGTSMTYESIDKTLEVLVAGGKSAQEINTLVSSDLVSTMANVIIFKGIFVIGKQIDDQLNKMMTYSTQSTEPDGEIAAIITQVFGWIDKLEEIKKRYAQYDLDKSIRQLNNTKDRNIKRSAAAESFLKAFKKSLA